MSVAKGVTRGCGRRVRLLAAAFALAFGPAVLAQPGARGDALIAPIEVLTCRYAEGKGPDQLDGLATAFNQWMEKSNAPQYAAYVLLPMAHSADLDFDLAWVGAWPDGTTMGESMAHYFERGRELEPAFGNVMQCGTNTNFSVVTLREPVDPGSFGPVEVASCTLRLGVTLDEALRATNDWVTYTATTGSTAAHWLLFPAYGERSDATYNYKWAVGYESYVAFGRDYDQATNGNGLDRYNELFAPLVRCDSPRLYRVRTIRAQHR